MDELNDDRSDDDEVEYAEEQRLDALAEKKGINGVAGRKVPVIDKDSATSLSTAAPTNRKEL